MKKQRLGRLSRFGRAIFLLFAGGYAIGLAIYLLLRLAFGDQFMWLALLNIFVPFYFLPLPLILLVALMLRKQWLVSLSIILTCTGLIWFAPRFVPRAHATPEGTVLRVVTFNGWIANKAVTTPSPCGNGFSGYACANALR